MSVRSASGSGGATGVGVAPEVGQVALGRGDRRRLVGDAQVDDAVGVLHVDRADLGGMNSPSPPPSIIAGPPIPMLESSVAMIASQQPSSAALPAKQ